MKDLWVHPTFFGSRAVLGAQRADRKPSSSRLACPRPLSLVPPRPCAGGVRPNVTALRSSSELEDLGRGDRGSSFPHVRGRCPTRGARGGRRGIHGFDNRRCPGAQQSNENSLGVPSFVTRKPDTCPWWRTAHGQAIRWWVTAEADSGDESCITAAHALISSLFAVARPHRCTLTVYLLAVLS